MLKVNSNLPGLLLKQKQALLTHKALHNQAPPYTLQTCSTTITCPAPSIPLPLEHPPQTHQRLYKTQYFKTLTKMHLFEIAFNV